ncbi:hypothetical protein [Rhodobacter ferrooxidans]|uniref:Lipoprotein n=1 Tax=Rhodobacter ferrooxidans TaxID=371731 RepID=C8RZ62_9RHOB|nr:hypothetical protein [Rhodobacter sp. SW2]EEW26019.1 conserved hypothetical protein [Rhodobacter sp. SW2]
MTLPLPFALLSLLTLAACTSDGNFRLYPLEGPIAAANPAQVIAIRSKNDSDTSGRISFRLPDPNRSKCEGTWSSVVPRVTSQQRGLSLSIRGLGGKYSNQTADVGGVNNGEIYAICDDGTRVQGRFISGSGTQSGTGTATDTLGNSYKLLF